VYIRDRLESSVSVYTIDPLSDSRWDELVARHPSASVFHQRGWLEALKSTYGYMPFALTTTPPDQALKNGMALCRVSSWLTGTRLVSLPFADHCEPLVDSHEDAAEFMKWLRAECEGGRCKYVEVRPLSALELAPEELGPSHSYSFHALDIRLPEGQLFEKLHKDSVQRKIRRAEKEGLSYEAGRSEQLQKEFYRLLLMTRRRHRLPPQPRIWFKNLVECMGDRALIRVARKNNVPVAAVLTLQHGSSAVYKYGCSDERFHNLGGMPMLFWRLIQESKRSGMETIDFGRSDIENNGLIAFKNKWGTVRSTLTYYRYPVCKESPALSNWDSRTARQFFALLPDAFMSVAGRILYRHVG
jgi:Acetyltransferase (GNAT) domain